MKFKSHTIQMLLTLFVWHSALSISGLIAKETDSARPSLSKSFEPIERHLKPKIAIVVDDLGDNFIIAQKLALLDSPLTMAILPHTPFSQKISQISSKNNHEVIMHLPMEANSKPELLGPGAIRASMSETELLETFLDSASTIPDLIGFNNHMGSALTRDAEKLSWLMRMARLKGWYYLDSKTSRLSVAEDIAKTMGIPTIGRDVFLDHHKNKEELPEIINKQMQLALKIADSTGSVVVICHPYQATYDFLSANLEQLAFRYEMVKVSELVNQSR